MASASGSNTSPANARVPDNNAVSPSVGRALIPPLSHRPDLGEPAATTGCHPIILEASSSPHPHRWTARDILPIGLASGLWMICRRLELLDGCVLVIGIDIGDAALLPGDLKLGHQPYSRFRLGSVGECHQFASTDLVALHLGSYRTDGLPGGAQSVDLPVDDHDIFSGEVNEQVLQLVIRYAVAGATLFDNNAGLDYHFASNLAMVGGNVVLNRATAKRGSQAGGGFVFTTSCLRVRSWSTIDPSPRTLVSASQSTTVTRSMTLRASSRARTPTTASSSVLTRRSGSSRRRN